MIHSITGTLEKISKDRISIETVSGLGFLVNVPESSEVYQKRNGENIKIFIDMVVREDEVNLYGFVDQDSLSLFRKLRTVNGVGAKAALSILSALTFDEICKAITFDDPVLLTKANGIGKKISQRIVLELSGKLDDLSPEIFIEDTVKNTEKEEAIEGLVVLGYTRTEAATSLIGVTEGLKAEEYIKIGLKNMRR